MTGGDSNVAAPLMAMASTLADELHSLPIMLSVLDAGLRDVVGRPLDRLASRSVGRLTVHWVPVSMEPLMQIPNKHLPRAAFLRLLIPDLLPDLKRVLWLDTDTLVTRDLAELWRTPLNECPIAAVPEYGAREVRGMISARLADAYEGSSISRSGYNSGVMILDLDHWRREKIGTAVLDISIQFGDDLLFADQDGLNIVLAGKWKELPLLWNVQLGALRSIKRVPAERISEAVLQQRDDLLRHPYIIHFAGSKPWQSGLLNPFRHRYFAALRRSDMYTTMGFGKYYLSSTFKAASFFISRRIDKLLQRS